MKHLPHFFHRAEYAYFHGSAFATQNSSHRFVTQSLEAAEHDELALFRRQLAQGAPQERQILLHYGGIVRSGARAFDHFHLTLRCWFLELLLLRVIGENIARDPVHPGFEHFARLIRMPIANHSQKYFVRQIFGGRLPSGQPEKKAEERLMAALVALAHAVEIA